MKRIILIGIFLIIATRTMSIDCKDFSKEQFFLNSDMVFLGKVTHVNEFGFQIVVFEVFKGEPVDTLRCVFNERSIQPKVGQMWLFYAKLDGKYVLIDVCSGSRSFDDPFVGFSMSTIVPPPPFFRDESMQYLLEEHWKSQAFNELFYEIQSLRVKHLSRKIDSLHYRLTIEEQHDARSASAIRQLQWTIIAIGIFVCMAFIFAFVRLKS